MEDFISLLSDSFSQFLSEKTAIKKENLQGSLISFAKEIDNFDFQSKLDSILKSSENSFYFSSQGNKFSFIAIDNVFNVTESGPARFTASDKKIKEVFGKFHSNWDDENFPLFVGGMKFTVEHSDDDWKDFSDSNWFVPEIIIYKKNERNYLLYNYFVEQNLSKTKLIEKFSKKSASIFNIRKKNISSSPRITNSSGLSPKDKKKWKQIVSQALEKIVNQEVQKVVLARKVELILSEEINLTDSLQTLRNDYPDCSVFAFHKGSSTFFGATPELLAKISKHKLSMDAIAGSTGRSVSGNEDSRLETDLLSSKKNLNEHQYVFNYLTNVLKKIGKDITYNENPSVKKLKNIQHLSTKISAELKDEISLINIIKELHPTPAVCGYPKDQALNLIKKIENQKRGLYSGIIGWFNQNGEGEFAVSIRSAVTRGNKLTAYAGGGIIEGSEPDAEFEETEMKLKPILSLFNEKKD
jgi:menaquinone-specific isochorismate synthase